jgi:hypothetical protein
MSSYAVNSTGSSTVGAERPRHDFRPTPPQPTESLLHFYRDILSGKSFHEGSCGDGAIARVMTGQGYDVQATDLIERGHGDDLFNSKGYGTSGVDFLKIDPKRYPLKQKSTVMNPPFSHWKEFAFKCHELEMPFIALFAKMTIWNAATRIELYETHPPKAVHPLTWRVDFDGRGRPTMDCCWVVWGDEVPFSNQPLERLKNG